jgi:hypothetical protein
MNASCSNGCIDSVPKELPTDSMTISEYLGKNVRQHHNNMPTGKEGQGGNFRRAFRRVRLVVEQASQEVERDKVSNHSHGGKSGAKG